MKGVLSHDTCDGMLRDTQHSFWTMWGERGYIRRQAGETGCWGEDPGPFFARIGTRSQCDVNWFEGCQHLEDPDARPEFSSDAPALLGSEESIYEYCNGAGRQRRRLAALRNASVAGRAAHHRELRGDISGDCIMSNKNVLRLLSHRKPWNMCQNLEWLMCAGRGLLPGQGSRKMHFADAPKRLDTRNDFWEGGQWESRYAVGDVYYLEICMLSQICRNSHELFTVEVGTFFECDLDAGRLAELQVILTAPRVSVGSET
eukprot:2619685-Prymnesium_polylepis.2